MPGPPELATTAIGGDMSVTIDLPYVQRPAVGDTVLLLGNQGDYVIIGTIQAGTWTGLSYAANVGDFGGGWEPGAYIKIGGIVYFRGLIQASAIIANTAAVFTMPVGFRMTPSVASLGLAWSLVAGGAATLRRVYMDGAGVVRTNGAWASGDTIGLGGWSYPADA